MVVGFLNPHPPAKRSRVLLHCEPSFFEQIRPGVLRDGQFPTTLSDATGEFHKPKGW